ncbi:MAG: hypothetical protein ABSG68_08665 [Thermoguttaceae bacterium]
MRHDQRFCGRPDCVPPAGPAPDLALAALALANLAPPAGRYYLLCRRCGKSFRADRPNRRFGPCCPRQARLNAARSRRPPPRYQRTCRHCGQRFFAARGNAAFCSPACRLADRAKRRRHGPRTERRPCAICGQAFIARRKNHVCCARAECRAAYKSRLERRRQQRAEVAAARKSRERARIKRDRYRCTVCGRPMAGLPDLRRNRYTCSPQCRREALRQKNRRSYVARRNRLGLAVGPQHRAHRRTTQPAIGAAGADG